MALVAAFVFSLCTAARDEVAPSRPASAAASPRCVDVAPLDDRYPLVVSVVPLDAIQPGLERLQLLRARDRGCIRYALGIQAAPRALLASLHRVALQHPELLDGVAVIPITAAAPAPALLWHRGHELRFQSLDAAAAAAVAYLP